VTTTQTGLGHTLADDGGRTPYLSESDSAKDSTCYGTCTGPWPPVTAPAAPHAAGNASAVVALTATLLNRTFTDAGHLTALVLGFAAGHRPAAPAPRGRPTVTRPPICTRGIG